MDGIGIYCGKVVCLFEACGRKREIIVAFLLRCPNCGEQSVNDFRFGGEVLDRPAPAASVGEWAHYFYSRKNEAGFQQEWWYHKFGCRSWFLALRDTRSNAVVQTFWPEEPPG